MLKNEVLNIDGRNWFVREAVSEESARNAIVTARVSGSIGAKETVNNDGDVIVLADVVRLNDDGTECLPYGEKGGTDRSVYVELAVTRAELAKSRADYDHLGRALGQSNLRNREYAAALACIDSFVTGELPCYHDAAFLRSESKRVIDECHANIKAAREAAREAKKGE